MKKTLLFATLLLSAQAGFAQCVTPANPVQVFATPSSFCSNTAVTTNINATTAAAFISWYTVPTGGTSLGTSVSAANFPVTLSSTTTYYAEAMASGGTITTTFSYTGSVQTFTVPAGVDSITIETWGAQGNSNALGVVGGLGGYATGKMDVSPGDILYINVGGGATTTTLGGFNGGGNGGNGGCSSAFGGGGGGASDVCYLNNTLNDRVIVGAGGGGAAGNRVSTCGRGNGGGGGGGYYGGGGGAAWPQTSVFVPTGGTQSSGGFGGTSAYTSAAPANNGGNGAFGLGGTGGLELTSNQAGNQNGSVGADGGGLIGNNGTYAGNFAGQSGAGGSSYTSAAMSNTSTTTGIRTGDGEVKITYQDYCPSSGRTPVTVTINPLPNVTATATPSVTVCENASVTLAGNGAVTYSWSGPVAVSNNTPFNAILANNGTYTVVGTDSLGCTNSDSITLLVIAGPTLSTSASDTITCAGDALIVSSSGATFFLWSTGGTTANDTVSPTVSTVYTVVGTDSLSGCSTTDSISITVNPLPTLVTNATSLVSCAGDTITLTVNGADNYYWSTTDTTSSIVVTPTSSTTYSVSGIILATGCFSSDTISLTVNALPVVSASVADSTICAGDTTSVTANGAATYVWSTGGTNSTEYVAPTTNATYTVTGTDSSGCVAQATVSVNVNGLPTVTVSATDSTICAGESSTLTASGTNAYVWAPSGNTNATEVVVPAATTTYSVTGTDSLTGCSSVATFDITVNPLPVVTVTLSVSTVCVDDGTLALTGGSPAGGTWSGNAVTGANFSPSTAGTGNQTITYSFTDGAGCTDSATATILVSQCVGVNENATCTNFTLFPNPANAEVVITWNSSVTVKQVAVTDVTGRVVMVEAANGGNSTTLHIAELPVGVYTVVVTEANGMTSTSRLIKN